MANSIWSPIIFFLLSSPCITWMYAPHIFWCSLYFRVLSSLFVFCLHAHVFSRLLLLSAVAVVRISVEKRGPVYLQQCEAGHNDNMDMKMIANVVGCVCVYVYLPVSPSDFGDHARVNLRACVVQWGPWYYCITLYMNEPEYAVTLRNKGYLISYFLQQSFRVWIAEESNTISMVIC